MKVLKEYGIYTVFIHPELFNNIPEAKFTMEFMKGIQYFDLRNIKREDFLINKLEKLKGVEDQVILINNHLQPKLYETLKSLSKNNYIIIFARRVCKESNPLDIKFIDIEQMLFIPKIFLYTSIGIIYYDNPKKLQFKLLKLKHCKISDKKYNNMYLWNFRYHMYKLFCR